MKDIFDFKRIKTNVWYNEAKLKITEIRRKDNKMISRKKLKKLCNQFLAEVKEKYPDADGLISVSIKYSNRWYSGDVSNFHQKINYFSLDDYEDIGEDPEEYEAFRFQYIPFKKTTEGGKDEHNNCLIMFIFSIL